MFSRNLFQFITAIFLVTLAGCADEGSINGKSLATVGRAPPMLSPEVEVPINVLE